MELTEEGKRILPFAKEALDAVNQINREVRELSSDNILRIAMANYVSDYSVFDISSKIVGFIRQHPLIEVIIDEETPLECMRKLEDGEADVAIAPLYDFEKLSGGMESVSVQHCPLVIATGNPDCRTLEEALEKTSFILEDFPGSQAVNDNIVPKLLEINPNTKFIREKATSFIESLIFSQEYSSMIPEVYMQKKYKSQLNYFRHEKFDIEMQFSLIYRKSRKKNRNIKEFLTFMMKA